MKKLLLLAIIVAAVTISVTVSAHVSSGRNNNTSQASTAQALPAITSVCPSLQIVEVTIAIITGYPTLQIIIRNNSDVGVHAFQLTMVSNGGRDHTRRGAFGGYATEQVLIAPGKTWKIDWPVADATDPIILASANFMDSHDEGEAKEIDHLRHHIMQLTEQQGASPTEVKRAHGKHPVRKPDCPPCKDRFKLGEDVQDKCTLFHPISGDKILRP